MIGAGTLVWSLLSALVSGQTQSCPLGENACAEHAPLFAQIAKDLAWWKEAQKGTGAVTQESHIAAMSELLGDQQPPLVQIVDNQIYCARYASARYEEKKKSESGSNCFPDEEDSSRLMSVFKLLHRMLGKYKVPDTQFFFSSCDSSLVNNNGPIPATKSHLLLSEAKTNAFRDILAPGHSFISGSSADHTQWARWLEPTFQADLGTAFPWGDKREVGFWRGINAATNELDPETGLLIGRMSYHRRRLVQATLAHESELIDARFVSDFNAEADRSQLVNFTSMRDHAAYKYLLHVDGATYSSRYMKLLLLNSVVFKQDSGWYEYFEQAMTPMEHFIPFDRHDTQKLVAQLKWAQTHDAEARAIGERGNAFARKHLSLEAAECYWWRLLTDYASIFDGGIKLSDSAVPFVLPVPPPKPVDSAKLRAALALFYKKHDPTKATTTNIGNIAKDFRGIEKKLAKALDAKYGELPFEMDSIRQD